ncbi:MAG: D-aminoacyl-tRNA deacylase [Desulfatibacillaceae bacterium]
MRAVVQRVSEAAVTVRGEVVGKIGPGLCVLLGVSREDGDRELEFVAGKVANLRIFEDEEGRLNRSLIEMGGQMLVVSQFTLYGDVRKGRRPSFVQAAPPEIAEPVYDRFVAKVRDMGVHVETGVFRAMMDVSLTNSGPVTIIVESP